MPPKQGDKVCLECGAVNGHGEGCSGNEDQVFEVLSVYSRAQAIEDGVLVDCGQPPFGQLNQRAGILVHVAMTVEAFDAYVHPIGGSQVPIKTTQQDSHWELSPHTTQLPPGQDMAGRYWDIIWMLRLAAGGQDDTSCHFRVQVVPNHGGPPEAAELKCLAGPDDEGNLCLTIMLPLQD